MLVRTLLATAALAAAPLAATTASAAPFIDQSQTVDSGAWGRLNTSTSWGESFKPGYATSVGAGFFIERFGSTQSGDVTISLLAAPLTSAGAATVIAKGTTSSTQGGWADVTWDAVTLAVGSTYYLYASSSTSLFVAYGNGNTYPGGQIYGDTIPYGDYYDLTFRTFADTAAAAGAVPEPASWAMLILGMGMVGYALRRRHECVAVTFG